MPDISELLTIETEQFSVQKLLETEIGGFSLGNLLAAAVILLISLVVIKLLTKAVRRALERSSSSAPYAASSSLRAGAALGARRAHNSGQAQHTLGLARAVLSVAGLAFSLSLQNTLSNVFLTSRCS
ncbi:MAG: mechanosensitive ion channel family protein [Oscillospiraceae bacterium]